MIRLIAILLLLVSCNPSDFGASYNSITSNPSSTETIYQKYSCEQNYTTAPTMVDFLFLWDNSGSQYFVTPETKAALNNLINSISTEFNYRILLAPLISYPGAPVFLVTFDQVGLSSSAQQLVIERSQADDVLSQFQEYAGKEMGMSRTMELLSTYFTQGVFRTNAYTNIVLMSNGDDESVTTSEPAKLAYAESQATSLKNFATQTLFTAGLRFLTLTAHSVCGTGFKQNIIYREVSKQVYNDGDAFNICNSTFTNIFNDINNTIKNTVVPYTYGYWPIRDSGSEEIDVDSIVLTEKDGSVVPRCSSSSCSNGFYYTDAIRTVNTRILPTEGEPFTGYSAQLFGSARVTFPNCLNVQYDTKTYYYGYIKLPSNPLPGSIQLTLNGETISEDMNNGWTYHGYAENLNTRIVSPTDTSPETPAVTETGYFLQLHGDAIYKSGDEAQATCLPQT